MDKLALYTSILLFFANVLRTIIRSNDYSQRSPTINKSYSYEKWIDLQPAYLEEQWIEHRLSGRFMLFASEFLFAISWIMLGCLVNQVSFILSKEGKRQPGTHILIMSIFLIGVTVVIITCFVTLGLSESIIWLIKNEFNLNEWNTNNGDGNDSGGSALFADGAGYRVLEMIDISFSALVVWIDAFEWICLSSVFVLIYYSARTERNSQTNMKSFNSAWYRFGLLIGIMCWLDFLSEVMRFVNWNIFTELSFTLSNINTVFFLPLWVLHLGSQLPSVGKCSVAFRLVSDQRSGDAEIIALVDDSTSGVGSLELS